MVEAGFYSDMVEYLLVNPATLVRFPAGTGKIFSLYDTYLYSKCSMRPTKKVRTNSADPDQTDQGPPCLLF